MQLEVEFDSLASLEDFWALLPPAEHKAWSQRARVRLFLIHLESSALACIQI